MKTKQMNLDVDYIVEQEPLTQEEETLLSAFFKERRLASKSVIKKQIKIKKRNLVIS